MDLIKYSVFAFMLSGCYAVPKPWVFQRRVNGSQDFFLSWSDYKNGFGTPEHELWLGNDKLHSATTQKSYEIRVDIVDGFGNTHYAKHNLFRISDESDDYRLSLGNYTGGTAGNGLRHNNYQAFTTRDHDKDALSEGNCATRNVVNPRGSDCNNNGAWWYNDERCSFAHFNSPFGSACFRWDDDVVKYCHIKYSEIKVRPF